MSNARFSAVAPFVTVVVAAAALLVSACGRLDTATAGDSDSGAVAGRGGEPESAAMTETGSDYSSIDYDGEPGPSALRGDRLAPEFPPPLIDPELIVSGGVPPDAIVPVDDPTFMAVADVRFLQPSEAVIVVEAGTDDDTDHDTVQDRVVKAYPVQILIWHEIVNDVIGGVPVSVTYCPLCNSAVAFERKLGGRLLDFGTSGELYQSALVMYDRQTESLWAHFNGRGLVGHYAGAELTVVPAQTLSFEQLVQEHPDALVLTRDTGASRAYGVNPYTGYDDEQSEPFGAFFAGEVDARLDPKARVVGLVIGRTEPVAVRITDIEQPSVIEVPGSDGAKSDAANVVVFHQPGLASALDRAAVATGRDVGQTGVFVPRADGEELTFRATDGGFVDEETGSVWTLAGEAVQGPLAGFRLEPVPHLNTFWFAWSAYYPETGVQET
jgi:hypothetical protein